MFFSQKKPLTGFQNRYDTTNIYKYKATLTELFGLIILPLPHILSQPKEIVEPPKLLILVQMLQSYLGVPPEESLHIGDQF